MSSIKLVDSSCHVRVGVIALMTLFLFFSMVEDAVAQNPDAPENGIELGALIFLGPDFRIYHREANSPVLIGFRHLDIKDDFINEGAVDLPDDPSDKEYTTRTGVYADYLFGNQPYSDAYYVSAGIFHTTLEIECASESDDDSATSLYFGGGYRGSFGDHFGYTIGLLFSPFVSLSPTTPTCSSEIDGDIDLNVGITYKF